MQCLYRKTRTQPHSFLSKWASLLNHSHFCLYSIKLYIVHAKMGPAQFTPVLLKVITGQVIVALRSGSTCYCILHTATHHSKFCNDAVISDRDVNTRLGPTCNKCRCSNHVRSLTRMWSVGNNVGYHLEYGNSAPLSIISCLALSAPKSNKGW